MKAIVTLGLVAALVLGCSGNSPEAPTPSKSLTFVGSTQEASNTKTFNLSGNYSVRWTVDCQKTDSLIWSAFASLQNSDMSYIQEIMSVLEISDGTNAVSEGLTTLSNVPDGMYSLNVGSAFCDWEIVFTSTD